MTKIPGNNPPKTQNNSANNLRKNITDIVFIDPRVSNYQSLRDGVKPGSEVVILDPRKDGVKQISDFLARLKFKSVNSVHVVSHGSEGSLQLGSTYLNADNLNSYANQLKKWARTLTDSADILLYGCDIVSGKGTEFVQQLSQITGADIAASTDTTGSAALGGDWDLEAKTGKVETSLAFKSEVIQAYNSILAATGGVSFINGTYSQDFGTLVNSGTPAWTDNSTIPGWYATRQNGGTFTNYTAGVGNSNTGALYSFGTASATDRALGSVASNTIGNIYYGLRLTNNTGSLIAGLKVEYTGEQWRNGGNTSQQKLNFSYQIGTTVTSLTTGRWTPITSLDFTGPIATGTAGQKNGNTAANKVAISSTINLAATPITVGEEIILRWEDVDDSGNDHGLAVDNVSITVDNTTYTYTPKVSFGAATYNTTEGSTATTFTIPVTLDATPGTTVTIPIVIKNTSTAAQSTDYTFTPSTITFAAGATGAGLTQQITFTIQPDDLPENAETVVLNFGTLTGVVAGTITETTLNIAANDSIQYAIATTSSTLTEGNSGTQAVTFTVTRSGGIGVVSTVDYALGGTAILGSDYNNIQVTNGVTASSGTLNFAVGENIKTITVDVLGDNTFELDENITITLSNPNITTAPANSTITTSSATVNITNDDTPPTISISDTSVIEGNTGTTNASFTVTLSNPSYQQVTVNYNTSDGTANTADYDYTVENGTITFAPGETSKTLSIGVIGDNKFETDETFSVNFLGATNATVADSLGVATITNDDTQPTISISDTSVIEGNTGTTNASFTVTLSNPSYQQVTVNYSTSDGTAQVGDSDYNSALGTVIFAPGETSKTLSIGVIGDNKFETDETFSVNFLGATNATVADNLGVATIIDDDNSQIPTISISDVLVNEGNTGTTNASFTIAKFNVSLSNTSNQQVTVDYKTSDFSAKVADLDYEAAQGTITFAPGEISKTISIVVRGDNKVETDEQFSVNLSGATNSTITDYFGVATIINDDNNSLPKISISDVSLYEGNDSLITNSNFNVTLSNSTNQQVIVNYSTNYGTTDSNDFWSFPILSALIFAPCETMKTISFGIRGDNNIESNEKFYIDLFGVSNADVTKGRGVGTILNDDMGSPF